MNMDVGPEIIQVFKPGDTVYTRNSHGAIRSWRVLADGTLTPLSYEVPEPGLPARPSGSGSWRE